MALLLRRRLPRRSGALCRRLARFWMSDLLCVGSARVVDGLVLAQVLQQPTGSRLHSIGACPESRVGVSKVGTELGVGL